MVPPLCDQIQRMSGKRAAAPVNITEARVRVVSVAYSMAESGSPGTTLRQQAAVSGWV